MRWLDFVWAVPVLTALGWGCGSNVVTNTGGAGGAGGGDGGMSTTTSAGGAGGVGATGGGMTTTSTTTSTTSTTTSTTTTGTGGSTGAACDQACAFAATCMVPMDQCLMYLDCSTMQGECFADCVNQPGVTCQDLFNALQGNPSPITACVGACQGGMGGAGGAGGAGGGPPADCGTCGQNSCQNAALQCFQQSGQAECQGWIDCAGGCTDAACVDACTMMYPGGAVLEQCACTSCAMECAPICNGSGTGGAGGGGMGGAGMGGAGGAPAATCTDCGQTSCQAAAFQCFQQSGQAVCQGWINCAGGCTDAACLDACTMMYPGGAGMEQCACTSCATECAAVCN